MRPWKSACAKSFVWLMQIRYAVQDKLDFADFLPVFQIRIQIRIRRIRGFWAPLSGP
jgi:hypothetical protein